MASKEAPSMLDEEDRRYHHYVLKRLPVSVLCVVCKGVLLHPVQIPCGERLCEHCYKGLRTKEEDPVCPKCEAKLKDIKVWRDVFAEKELDELEVYCVNKEAGCDWQGERKNLKDHVATCLKSGFTVSCPHCSKRVLAENMETHYSECSQYFINCPVCSESITQSELSQHLEICPKKEMICEVPGCSHQCQFKDLPSHNQTCLTNHIAYLSVAVKEVTETISSLKLVSNNKPEKEKELSSKDDLAEKVESVSQQCADIEANQKMGQAKILEACYQSVDNLQKETRNTGDNLTRHFRVFTEKMLKMEEIITSQSTRISELERGGAGRISVSESSSQQDRILATHDVKLAEYGLRIDMLDCKNAEGVLLWKITEVRRRRREAALGKVPSIYSQPFYTSTCGYKMCGRLYFNGDGMGKGTHLSLFFVVMRGEFDSLLPWPFKQKVTLVLVDQGSEKNHVADTFRPDPSSSSFRRPRNEMNIASGCPLFVSLPALDSGSYVKDDCMFVKIVVDLSGIPKPDSRVD